MDVHPKPIHVSSGVPKWSLLGPLLFLIYIHDFPMNAKSKVRLLANDTALYLTFSTSSQSMVFQNDLDNLERWSHKWDMEFNPSECRVIHITRSKKNNSYTVHSSQLHTGISILSKLYWCRHLFRPIMGYAHKSHF